MISSNIFTATWNILVVLWNYSPFGFIIGFALLYYYLKGIIKTSEEGDRWFM